MTFGPTSSALDCFVIFDWFFEKLFKLKFGYEDGKSHGSRERERAFILCSPSRRASTTVHHNIQNLWICAFLI